MPQTRDLRKLLRHVREPLLAVVEESPDFDGAYAPLLGMARQLSTIDPEGGRRLLLEIIHARPERPEARHLLDALSTKGGYGPRRKPLPGVASALK